MSSPAVAYARQNYPRFLDELKALLRIPSISTLPEHKGDCRHAAEVLAAELKRNIDASTTTKVVEALKDAEVVLRALNDEREKSVVATTAANQVREYELRSRFRFQLRTVTGKELLPASEILLKRELTYTESAALAKEE